jgi:hypothetical protein
MNGSLVSLARTGSWAMMRTSAFPKFSLPPVWPRRDPNIPTGSDPHGEARPERDRLDLDLRKILLGRRRKGYAHAQGNKHHPEASRRVPSSSNQSHAATPLQSASAYPPK